MPYLREGDKIYKQNPDGSKGELVGHSRNPKAYLRALYAHEPKTKQVSAVASPNYLHGPGSLLGVPGMGQPTKQPRKGKKSMSVKDWFDNFFGTHTKEASDAGLGGYLVDADGEKHLPTSRNGKPDRALAGAAWAALFSPGGHRGQKYAGPHKAEAQKKLRALYERENWETPSSTKEASLSVTKGANGNWRWILFSSSIYEDRDDEIVSQQAQDADVARMNETKEFKTLDWWHVGTPTEDDPAPELPMLAIGDCDFAAMHGGIRVESGTFYDERIGDAVATHAKELSASLAFRHPKTEPDESGVFTTADTLERSILPKDHASNLLADVFTTKEKVMDTTKVKELATLLGDGGDELVNKLLAAAEHREQAAQAAGIRSKEAKKKDAEAEAEAEAEGEAAIVPHIHTEKPDGFSVKMDEGGYVHAHSVRGKKGDGLRVMTHQHTDGHLKEAEAAKKEAEAACKEGAKKEAETEAEASKKEIVSTDPMVNIQLLLEKMCEKLDLIQIELEQAEDRAGVQEDPAAEQIEQALAASKEASQKRDAEIATLKEQLGIVTKDVKTLRGDLPKAVRDRLAVAGDWNRAEEFLEHLKAENEKTGTKETAAGPAQPNIVDWLMKPLGQ